MKSKIFLKFFVILALFLFGCSNDINDPQEEERFSVIKSPPIESFYPIPSKAQLKWQDSELMLFIHFGINTFTGKEWGDGTEDPSLFNPKTVDAEQWVKVAKEAGFNYLIFTAKHHDGFCLWPSKYTDYTIKNSLYKNGHGDIVKEVSDACKKYNMNFGLYLSPWDRHEPSYGTETYDIFYQNQLIELLTNYGKISEMWLDGANGDEIDGMKVNY
ncbi:MAG: alpha-L-fucosidase, partial [Ignavibacteriaceae bacterium]